MFPKPRGGRGLLYWLGLLLGDYRAVKSGTIAKRAKRRAWGRIFGRFFR